MSIKQQLAAAVEEMPDLVTIEEAIQRIYQAFKMKRAIAASDSDTTEASERMVAALEALAARGALRDIADPVAWEREVRQERSLPGRG